jgi:serine protease Do
MVKKYVFASVILVIVGVVLGAVMVSSFGNGVDLGLAYGGDDVRLGGPAPIAAQNATVKALSDNFAAVSKAASPSVVAIKTTTTGKERPNNMPRDFFHFFQNPQDQESEPQPQQGYGSGVVVTADGYIVTNNHVVADAAENGIEVIFNEKVQYKAKLIGTDPSTDLAVIKIDAKNLVPAALGNSENVQVGEWVVAIGNPLGLTSTVTAGIVSAIGRNINIIQDQYGIESFIQTDAAINPGNSGGALINMSGEVIGINTAIATTNARYQGYGFAVPVNILKTVATDLIKFGEVKRGYIGVQITTVDQVMANALGLKEAKGVIIQKLVDDGAAAAAGLKDGDVILEIDGREVNRNNELQSYIATRHPGDVVTLKVFRDGKTFDKKVSLRPRSGDVAVTKAKDENAEEPEAVVEAAKSVAFDALGFTVRAMTAEERKALKTEKGVLVSEVKAFGEAAERSIGRNDVILEADRKLVSTPGELKKIISGHKSGDSVLLRIKRDETTAFVAIQVP